MIIVVEKLSQDIEIPQQKEPVTDEKRYSTDFEEFL